MCGIAGIVDPRSTSATREAAVRGMCAAMVHRGPDDEGIESIGDATLGMRRLAIFDPANGHQPFTTPDGRYSIIFNGSIFNFQSLQKELGAAGWRFKTRCDTEVLLAALAHWGEGALKRLRGMFAFALWDRKESSLLLARDPFGIKPLYFMEDGGRLAFASEINALISSGVSTGEIDPSAVAQYLAWLAVPAPQTIYRGIFTLRPGELLTLKDGIRSVRTYWSLRSIPEDVAPANSRGEFLSMLRERLEDTIRAHMLADVPVGAFLSGGLDSAVVASLMSKASGRALRTFSIGFGEPEFSEAHEAEENAQFFGAIHQTRIVTGAEVAADIGRFIDACDQPTGDGINTYYVSRTAHEGGVTAALSGLGGDELFGGYPSFREFPRLFRALPRWRALPRPILAAAESLANLGGARGRKFGDMIRYATGPHEIAALHRRLFAETDLLSVLSPAAAELGERSPFHPSLHILQAELGDADPHDIASAWELRTYMADVLLRDSDVMSMRHSLELRVPFVDRPLIEWLWRQPVAFRRDFARPKSALADACSDILPPALLTRRKRGFTMPFAIWMKGSLKPFLEETFSAESVGRSGLFSTDSVQTIWRRFVSGEDHREWSRVWSLAVLVAFTNRSRRRPA